MFSATEALVQGIEFHKRGELDEAIACYRRALAVDPYLVEAHCNLAAALRARGQDAEAKQSYLQAVQCNPRVVEAQFQLGVLLEFENDTAAAIECYQNAIRHQPDHVGAYFNLGMIYKMQGDIDRGIECYRKALEFQPNFAVALNNLGTLLKIQSRIAEARACFEQALRIDPGYVEARCNQALLLLAEGDYAAGWPLYELRTASPEFSQRSFDKPRWRGEALAGRTLLVHYEQGLGDTMQFVRFVPLLAQRGESIILEVQPQLVPLLKQSGLGEIVRIVGEGEPLGPFGAYVPLVSLPAILGTTPESIPAAGGYLAANPRLVDHWRGVLGDARALKVGIAWQGTPTFLGDRFRSMSLAEFAPLALPGVELVSLQKGPGVEQLAEIGDQFHVRDLGRIDEEHGAFMDTAAIIKNLDLVVTCDSAIGHLAGGLGVDVWIALMLVPDWRWMLARSDSPWYASARLFRQQRLGDWPGVFGQMADALGEVVRARQ